MENTIYRIELSENKKLEFFIAKTNNLETNTEEREMSVVVIGSEMQLDGDLNETDLNFLIDYLQDCRRYINNFNSPK